MHKNKKGFTLIELLIVIAVMAILTAVVFVTLNPLARFQDARNADRWASSNAILSALKMYQIDNDGSYIPTVEALSQNVYYQIGTAESSCGTSCYNPSMRLYSNCVDLSDLTSSGYLGDVPIDPSAPGVDSARTGYYVYIHDTGLLSVGSCYEEQGASDSVIPIEVSR